MKQVKRKDLLVLGVCAGQGALLHPFKRYLIGNVEPRSVFHTPHEEQWNLNFPKATLWRELPLNLPHPNVILSSPDCGASSVMRLSKVKVLGNPEKNKSLNLTVEAILHYKPEFFLVENLPRLLSLIPKEYFDKIFKDYGLIFHQYSVRQFGNSQQSRKRLIILGIRADYLDKKECFEKVYKVNVPKLASFLLKEPFYGNKNTNYMPPLKKVLAMYDYRLLPKKINLTVQEIHDLWMGDFKAEKKWPINTKKMKTLPGVYRLLGNKYPLTVRPADRQFRPDGWPLGIDDFKSIMGFPKTFKIYMDLSDYTYWLNKARYTLCKGSVYEVGLWFKECLWNALLTPKALKKFRATRAKKLNKEKYNYVSDRFYNRRKESKRVNKT